MVVHVASGVSPRRGVRDQGVVRREVLERVRRVQQRPCARFLAFLNVGQPPDGRTDTQDDFVLLVIPPGEAAVSLDLRLSSPAVEQAGTICNSPRRRTRRTRWLSRSCPTLPCCSVARFGVCPTTPGSRPSRPTPLCPGTQGTFPPSIDSLGSGATAIQEHAAVELPGHSRDRGLLHHALAVHVDAHRDHRPVATRRGRRGLLATDQQQNNANLENTTPLGALARRIVQWRGRRLVLDLVRGLDRGLDRGLVLNHRVPTHP